MIHQPKHRSRVIFDLDSTVVTVFGRQDGAQVGYNPRYRGKRSYNPLLCFEANSSYLWDTELRPGNAGTWDSSVELLDTCFANDRPISERFGSSKTGRGRGAGCHRPDAKPLWDLQLRPCARSQPPYAVHPVAFHRSLQRWRAG